MHHLKTTSITNKKQIMSKHKTNNPIKIYTSKNNRSFRLVKIENEQPESFKGKYTVVIKWLDNDKNETFPYEIIEKYLIN